MFVLWLALLLIFPFPNQLQAAPGALDTSFAEAGWRITSLDSLSLYATDMALQSDGKIVLCGYAKREAPNDFYFLVARYHPDGRLDETFVGNRSVASPAGIVISDFAESTKEKGNACVIQSDGQIVVVGHGYQGDSKNFAVARYKNTNGNLDISFNEDGRDILELPFFSEEGANAVALLPNGKIVAAGYGKWFSYKQFALVRYKGNDGELDTTLNGSGMFSINFPTSTQEEASALAVRSDGNIVVAGFGKREELFQLALAHLKAGPCAVASCFDMTFSGDGKELTDLPESTDEIIFDIAVQPDGKVIAVGGAKKEGANQFFIARYKAGSCAEQDCLENHVTTDFESSSEEVAAVVKIKDDKIYLGGMAKVGEQNKFALARYQSSDLALDQEFGNGGKVLLDHPNFENEIALGLAFPSDGKILAGGIARQGEVRHLAIAKLLNSFLSDLTVAMRENPDSRVGPNERAYIVTVTNHGPDAASDVVVTLTPPAGSRITALPYLCEEGEPITCNVGDLDNGANFTFGLIVDLSQAPEGGSFALNVNSGQSDVNRDDNVALLSVAQQASCSASDPNCSPAGPTESQVQSSGGCLCLPCLRAHGSKFERQQK